MTVTGFLAHLEKIQAYVQLCERLHNHIQEHHARCTCSLVRLTHRVTLRDAGGQAVPAQPGERWELRQDNFRVEGADPLELLRARADQLLGEMREVQEQRHKAHRQRRAELVQLENESVRIDDKFSSSVPRRHQLFRMTPEERAIQDLVWDVEKLGAHVFLTDVVVLLGKARDRLADWVDLKAEKS